DRESLLVERDGIVGSPLIAGDVCEAEKDERTPIFCARRSCEIDCAFEVRASLVESPDAVAHIPEGLTQANQVLTVTWLRHLLIDRQRLAQQSLGFVEPA